MTSNQMFCLSSSQPNRTEPNECEIRIDMANGNGIDRLPSSLGLSDRVATPRLVIRAELKCSNATHCGGGFGFGIGASSGAGTGTGGAAAGVGGLWELFCVLTG